jgi:hypothetical protein
MESTLMLPKVVKPQNCWCRDFRSWAFSPRASQSALTAAPLHRNSVSTLIYAGPTGSGGDVMSEVSANTADLFEIIRTTRSMRRLKPDSMPNELIRKILEAGVCAPSGGNMQRWRFLVVRDPKVKFNYLYVNFLNVSYLDARAETSNEALFYVSRMMDKRMKEAHPVVPG